MLIIVSQNIIALLRDLCARSGEKFRIGCPDEKLIGYK
jgi:hypothetical protein